MRTSMEPNKIYIIQKVLMRVIQNVTFIEFEPLCQKLWVFISSFTMTTHQIWSCHMNLAINIENFYFLPYSMLNFRKSYQIWGKLAQERKSYTQKNKTQGGKHPPKVFIGLRQLNFWCECHTV